MKKLIALLLLWPSLAFATVGGQYCDSGVNCSMTANGMPAVITLPSGTHTLAQTDSPTFTGTTTIGVTGSTQCLHVNSSGVISGTGSDCGSGGSGITINTTAITGGTTTRVLYDNAGTVGEYTVSGSGNVAMTTSPTFTTPALGTPSALVLTNATGTPTSIGLANGTGLPVSTGISGLGSNVATFLATPSSANLISALTDETGSGAAVFAGSPTLTGTVSAAALTLSSTLTTNVTGSTQCLHVNSSGVVSGTGSDCGSGGGSGITVGTTTVTSGTDTKVLYNNAGVVGEYTITGTANVVMSASPTLTGTITAAAISQSDVYTNSKVGAASTSAWTLTGTPYTAGTATTNFPLAYINAGTSAPTSFSASGTVIGINAPVGFAGNFLDLHVNGAAGVASIDSTGGFSGNQYTTTNGGGGGFISANTGSLSWSGRGRLTSSAAGTINFGAADASSPVAQTLKAQSQITTSNTAGQNFTIIGSLGTGTATGGQIIFKTGAAGSSGATQNTATTAMVIDGSQHVGIGTTTTGAYPLYVTNASGSSGYFGSTGSNQANLHIDNAAGSQGSYLSYDNAGSQKWTQGNNPSNSFQLYDIAAAKVAYAQASNGTLTIGEAQTTNIDINGNVGIGTATPQAALDVLGNLKFNGDVCATATTSKTSNTTLGNITGLSVTLASNKNYHVQGRILYHAGASGGIKFDFGGGSASLTSGGVMSVMPTISDNTFVSGNYTILTSLTGVNDVGVGVTSALMMFDGTIQTGASGGGTLIPRFAQSTSNGTATVIDIGSCLTVTQLN